MNLSLKLTKLLSRMPYHAKGCFNKFLFFVFNLEYIQHLFIKLSNQGHFWKPQVISGMLNTGCV